MHCACLLFTLMFSMGGVPGAVVVVVAGTALDEPPLSMTEGTETQKSP